MQLTDDADLEEIFDKLSVFENVLFDPHEREKVKMMKKDHQVAKQR